MLLCGIARSVPCLLVRGTPMATVLIVDDDEDTRAVIRMALVDEGHSVSEAVDGESALEALRLATAAWVVMVDEHMPGTSGAQMLRLIATDPALRGRHVFVLMTADTRAATALQGDDGLHAIISTTMLKPFDLYQMIDLIQGLGDGLEDGHEGHDGHDGHHGHHGADGSSGAEGKLRKPRGQR
jgi:CheY-like chemotaxis protein